MMFISFSPLAAFPHITPKLRASICYEANRSGYGGPFDWLAYSRHCDDRMTRVGLSTFSPAEASRQLSRRPLLSL
jgi:hypothetical protein